MKRIRLAHLAACLLSLAAAVISYQLLLKHVTGSKAAGWFEAGCTDDQSAGARNCAAVLASPYSYFPPKHSDKSDGQAHFPVAFLGLVYYSALSVWWLGVGRPSPSRRRLHLAPLLVVGFGLAGSAYFTFVMFHKLDQWCPWCMVTHGLNLLIALCAVLMWPGRIPAAGATLVKTPSTRAVWLTVLAIVILANGQLNMLGLFSYQSELRTAKASYDACMTQVNRIKGDAPALVRQWQSSPQRTIALRPDDPIRLGKGGDPNAPAYDVVVFSDFECPSCKRFASFLEEQAQPLFAGRIRTLFKHYPIDRTCNTRAAQTMHPHACEGVRLAEGARSLGGSDAFWRVHDYLYQNRDALAAGKVTPGAVARAVGLDEGALAGTLTSESIHARIEEDIEQARLCEIRGTPSVFVEGRLVDTLAVTELGFWDQLANRYWQQINVARPESTKLKTSAAPTPDTQDRKAAP